MNVGTKLSATVLAALLACAPMGAFAWTGSQSNSGAATANRPATQMGWGLTGTSDSDQQSPATVAWAKQQLQKEGYYKKYGPVDGVTDPNTHAAIRSFQQSKWIAPTGQLNTQTMAALQADQQSGARSGTG